MDVSWNRWLVAVAFGCVTVASTGAPPAAAPELDGELAAVPNAAAFAEGTTASGPLDPIVNDLSIAQAHIPPTELVEVAGFTGTARIIGPEFDQFDDGLGSALPLSYSSGFGNEPPIEPVLARIDPLLAALSPLQTDEFRNVVAEANARYNR